LNSENDYTPLISSHKNLHSQVSLSTINPIFKESALAFLVFENDRTFNLFEKSKVIAKTFPEI